MTAREKGFLLLTSHLGDPGRRVLTPAQLRQLSQRMQLLQRPGEDRELCLGDLIAMGYSAEMAERILRLLGDGELLDHYVRKAAAKGCVPVTRVSGAYPLILRKRLGTESPGCLWARGDISLLAKPGIALVGSRDLGTENSRFAQAVGRSAARHGLVLISGNARGADKAAQDACLEAGGQVISVVADTLWEHSHREGRLCLSEDGFDLAFSPQRALSRNRVIHALGRMVFVAQSGLGTGGTWDGTVKNLRSGWSSVACFRDGSAASLELEQRGAFLVGYEDLADLGALLEPPADLFSMQK